VRRRRLVVLLEIIVPVIVLLLVLVLIEVVLVRLVSERKEGGGKAGESVNAKVEVGVPRFENHDDRGRAVRRTRDARPRPPCSRAPATARDERGRRRAFDATRRTRASISDWGSERERDEGVFVVAERQAPPNSDVLSARPRRSTIRVGHRSDRYFVPTEENAMRLETENFARRAVGIASADLMLRRFATRRS